MKMKEWIVLLVIAGVGMMFANFVGFGVAFGESLSGMLVLLVISLLAVVCDKYIPIKLPVVAYCSIIGLLLACPLSPVSGFVVASASKINFTAPLTMVGAFAGMSISNQLKSFAKQGWVMIVISIFVMTGTFIGSLLVSQAVLSLTGQI